MPEALSLLSLPVEVLVKIFSHIPTWARRVTTGGTVHSLASTCTVFRDLLDETVVRLDIYNTSNYLTVNALCDKIRRCSRHLRRLRLEHIFLTTPQAHARLVAAVNECSRLRTLVLTPGTGGSFVFEPLAFTRVPVILVMPWIVRPSKLDTSFSMFVSCVVDGWRMIMQRSPDQYGTELDFRSLDVQISDRPVFVGKFVRLYHTDCVGPSQDVVLCEPGNQVMKIGNVTNAERLLHYDRDTIVHAYVDIDGAAYASSLSPIVTLKQIQTIAITTACHLVLPRLRVADGHEVVVMVPWRDLRRARAQLSAGMSLLSID